MTIRFNYYPWLGLDFDNPLVCLPDFWVFFLAVLFVSLIPSTSYITVQAPVPLPGKWKDFSHSTLAIDLKGVKHIVWSLREVSLHT